MLRFAIPFIISNITVPLASTVDTALMGHFGSQAHLGAIGLGSSIFNFLYWNNATAFVWDGIYLGATAAKEQRNATILAAVVFFLIYYFLRGFIGNHALLLAQLSFFGIRGIVQTIYYKTAILDRFFKPIGK